MIRINFDPNELRENGSLQFLLSDLQDAPALALKLRDSVDALSQYLRTQLTADGEQELIKYSGSGAVSDALRDAILTALNQLLNGPMLFERKRFKGVTFQRETLIKELVKLKPSGDALVALNKLLLEDAYPQELKKSPLAAWDGWSLLARAATEDVIAQWESWKTIRAAWKKKSAAEREKENPPDFKPAFQDDVWKGFRDWLLDYAFHNKCAYCETPVVGFPGDAEHFRPKGRVRVRLADDDFEIITIVDEDGDRIAHPGYFWLAYHWENLLPACETCNRGGKNDLFPVANPHVGVKKLGVTEIDHLIHKITESKSYQSIFYLEPDDLDQMEGRLLLHPYRDYPQKHIYFKTDGTAAEWQKSEHGKKSIETYNLNHTNTVTARQREQKNGNRDYSDTVLKALPNLEQARNAAQTLRSEYYNGNRPYGAAVFDFIHFYLDKTLVDPEILLKDS